MPAIYDGLVFRTALDAQWAAFFDLEGWQWQYNPAPVGNWAPEFRVSFPCAHSECAGRHTLLVAVVDVDNLEGLNRHPALRYSYGTGPEGISIPADAGALFGSSPAATTWEMSHGAGGGVDSVPMWASAPAENWEAASRAVTLT